MSFSVLRDTWLVPKRFLRCLLSSTGSVPFFVRRLRTVPAKTMLLTQSLLPDNVRIVGYSRSELSQDKFRESFAPKLKGADDVKERFLKVTFCVGSLLAKVVLLINCIKIGHLVCFRRIRQAEWVPQAQRPPRADRIHCGGPVQQPRVLLRDPTVRVSPCCGGSEGG